MGDTLVRKTTTGSWMKMQKVLLITVLLPVLLLVAGLAAIDCLDLRQRLAHHDELWNFTRTCTPIIAWLESERARSGAYPAVLPTRFKAVLDKVQPKPWYGTSVSNTAFSIGFGDYGKDGFQYHWDSDRLEWMWNG
jgi:hypothetical protein